VNVTVDDIREHFPKANYAPDPTCKRCNGTGIRCMPGEQAAKIKILDTNHLPCICIFVKHDDCDLVAELLSSAAKRALVDLGL
jgi:hypothetical protein